jgi:hypothetical protein
MVGRKNVSISLWWAIMLPTLRTTALECHVVFEWSLIQKIYDTFYSAIHMNEEAFKDHTNK